MRLNRLHGLLVAALGAAGAAGADDGSGRFDILIEDALIVDGTGDAPYEGDVLVRDGRIAFIGSASDREVVVERTIDAAGRVLAPGFIDMHAHGDPLSQSLENFLAMGVTTIVLGQDGRSPQVPDEGQAGDRWRVSHWIQAAEARGLHANVALLSGHGTLRRAARIPDEQRRPTAPQLDRMLALMEADLEAGAFGLSTGLEYVPGIYAGTEELEALAKRVGAHHGIVMSHMRSEDLGKIEGSIEELLRQAQYARVHISHLKIVYAKEVEAADRLLAYIASKRRAGFRLTADAYPYTAGYTGLGILFPEWSLADYPQAVTERRAELSSYLRQKMTRRGGPDAFLFGTQPWRGKTLAEAAEESGQSYVEFLIDAGPGGGAGAHFIMDADVQDRLFASPLVAVATDGGPGIPHPRATGTFAKLIEEYVVKRRLLSIEQAVHKATGLPANTMGFPDRGTIQVANRADLVLFDPARIAARSDYVEPARLATGFDVVIVNGRVAWDAERVLHGRFGTVLRHSGTAGEAR